MTNEMKMIKCASNVQTLISKFELQEKTTLPIVKKRYSAVPHPIVTPFVMINTLTLDNIKIKKQLKIFNAILEANQCLDNIAFINSVVNIIINKNNSIIANNNKLKAFVYCQESIDVFEERNDCYRLDNDILMCYIESIPK